MSSIVATKRKKTKTKNDNDCSSGTSLKRRKDTAKYINDEIQSCHRNVLLCLCDGGENSIFSTALMEFLTVDDVSRCEMVCRDLKHQAKHCWNMFDKIIVKEHPSRISRSAKTARERVIRYHLASSLAERIGNMGQSVSEHCIFRNFYGDDNKMIDERMNGGCTGHACNFPDLLDFGVFKKRLRSSYELFVRFSKTSDNSLLAEGFVTFMNEYGFIETELDHLIDISNWSQMMEINRLVKLKRDDFDDYELLNECMSDLTATVVGVRTKEGTCIANLVMAQSGFGESDRVLDGGIGIMGDNGYFWGSGRLSSRSHGPLNLGKEFYRNGDRHREHKDMDVKLGLSFSLLTWNDAEDSSRVVKEECCWTLQCSYENDFG